MIVFCIVWVFVCLVVGRKCCGPWFGAVLFCESEGLCCEWLKI